MRTRDAPLSLEAKLRLHLAQHNAQWRHDVAGFSLVATWHDQEARMLLAADTPIRAALVVDAFTLAQRENAHATLVHQTEPSGVARDAAARLGVFLLDADTLPDAPDAPVMEMLAASLGPLPTVEPVQPPAATASAIEALVAVTAMGDETTPLLEAHADAQVFGNNVTERTPEAPVFAAESNSTPEAVFGNIVTQREPVAIALPPPPAPAPTVLDVFPPLPWSSPAPQTAVATVTLTDDDRFAMPWNPRPPEPDHEVMAGSPRRVKTVDHPTSLQGVPPNWGLPWPRLTAPADGLALHDPTLWSAKDRVHALREDLELKGGSSFGAVQNQGSAWLKRIQSYGSP